MPKFVVKVETNWCGAEEEAIVEASSLEEAEKVAEDWATETVGMSVTAREIEEDEDPEDWDEI